MADILKSCPFCGEEPTIKTKQEFNTERQVFFIRCENENCFVSVSTMGFSSLDAAVEAWNRRADNG